MIKYLLLETNGRVFDRLVGYIQYHSLSDLLIEVMQLNIFIKDTVQVQNKSALEDDAPEDEENPSAESEAAVEEIKKQEEPKLERHTMHEILQRKKVTVIQRLITSLSHKNRDNIEEALNASAVLIELIELEKTFEIFLDNKAELLGRIMELAADPSNKFNQQYLLQVLLVVCKQLKMGFSQAQNVFKELGEKEDDTAGNNSNTAKAAGSVPIPALFQNFDKDS